MIGDNIKKIRLSRNLTQAELAEMVHVKRQTVSSWEINRTEPNMGIIESLADVLNCKKSDIIGESSEGRKPITATFKIERRRSDKENAEFINSLFEIFEQYVPKITDQEMKIILAYRIANQSTKNIICKILDIEKETDSELSKAE